MLETFDHIRNKRIKNKVVYFESTIPSDFDKSLFVLRNQDNVKILNYIISEPEIELENLEIKAQLKPRKIKKIILDLKESDLISEILGDRQIKYRANLKNINPTLKILKKIRIKNNEQRDRIRDKNGHQSFIN